MPTTKKDELQNLQNPPAQQMTVPTQSSTVQQAQNMLQQQLSGRTYQSPWQPKINDMMTQYLNRDKFTYDLNADALYNQLREQYALMGQQAMMDTMGQAAMLTGGYGNSYAQSVGQQAYQGYMQLLSDKVPDLYQLALNQYLSEGEKMQSDIGMMMQQDSIDYGKYRDQIADQDDAYSKLVALMNNYGYTPTPEEMAYAGMTDAQMKAILGIKDGGGGAGGTGGNGDPPGDPPPNDPPGGNEPPISGAGQAFLNRLPNASEDKKDQWKEYVTNQLKTTSGLTDEDKLAIAYRLGL